MKPRIEQQMTHLEFLRRHTEQGNADAFHAAGAMATQTFFEHQVPHAHRIPRRTLHVIAEQARERAEVLADTAQNGFYQTCADMGVEL